jgi:hypothetical protein
VTLIKLININKYTSTLKMFQKNFVANFLDFNLNINLRSLNKYDNIRVEIKQEVEMIT